ncbi:hypothetical protein An02g11840 [Aspergillus niger]|uniref:Uncharacterized protein n=2 Tax=Aspergillus niger TaxID=5061 RepID=A2QEQ1_ASPNC|nr:hypothetical protein An02g11840 [Aspergillus niger]CAK96413.1 hypothetical protein An02g11840 [Aspergillus niger]
MQVLHHLKQEYNPEHRQIPQTRTDRPLPGRCLQVTIPFVLRPNPASNMRVPFSMRAFPTDSNRAYLFLLPSIFSIYPHGPEAYVFLARVGVRIKFDLTELPEQACLKHEFGDIADCLRYVLKDLGPLPAAASVTLLRLDLVEEMRTPWEYPCRASASSSQRGFLPASVLALPVEPGGTISPTTGNKYEQPTLYAGGIHFGE